MFPTDSERLIGISDAFSAFVYGYPSSCPRAHCTPNKSVTTLRYTRRHGPVYIQAMPVGTYRVQSPGFLRSSIKNRIIVLRTVQSMFSELTVRPIKNGLYKGSVACFDF